VLGSLFSGVRDAVLVMPVLHGDRVSGKMEQKRTFVKSMTNKRQGFRTVTPNAPVYLDCNATVPLAPAARDAMLEWLDPNRPSNAGSRTHAFGSDALHAVSVAREQIARVAVLAASGVVFTSGATEANNLAILGLAAHGEKEGLRHVVSTQVEHKAVLEPLQELERRGFEVSLVPPDSNGRIQASDVLEAIRRDTLLVSVMQVNNETGMTQPVEQIAEALGDRLPFFHVDASQGFGKQLEPLRHERVDLISISAHKIGGPIGVGALLICKRDYRRPPLSPLAHGGGQERGLRPGTLPTALIVGFGAAAATIREDHSGWTKYCEAYRDTMLQGLKDLKEGYDLNMELSQALPNCINMSIRDGKGSWLDAEAVLLALKPHVAASNGSACTSAGMEQSHVLRAQHLPEKQLRGAVRLSWCERTPPVDWCSVCEAVNRIL